MLIYRPGAITAEMIRQVAGPVEMFQSRGEVKETPAEALPSPGVGLRHYAPKARLILLDSASPHSPHSLADSSPSAISSRIAAVANELPGETVGVMLPEGVPPPALPSSVRIFAWGSWTRPEEMAQTLYAGLRTLDELGCTVILCPLPPHDGIGVAIRDRLGKAAQGKVQDLGTGGPTTQPPVR
jgi:L-threonylcarbamoyladenylate synthase